MADAEFERLLTDFIGDLWGAWARDEAPQDADIARTALIAYHEQAVAERDAEIVRQFERIGDLTESLRRCVEGGGRILAERDARIAELEKDAGRYQWLGKNAWRFTDFDTGAELDSAIDEAMSTNAPD